MRMWEQLRRGGRKRGGRCLGGESRAEALKRGEAEEENGAQRGESFDGDGGFGENGK